MTYADRIGFLVVEGVVLMPRPWLVGLSRRTNGDIRNRLGVEQIYSLIVSKAWPYKTEREFYQKRDRALMSLLFLTAD